MALPQELNEATGLTYVPYVLYNGTTPAGGDSLTSNLNLYYQTGDIAWLLTCTTLVFLMISGIGFFYSGLTRRKSALSILLLPLLSSAVVSMQLLLWGYSLAFSHSASAVIGDLANVGFRGVLAQPSVGSARVPDLLFAVYQGMFAAFTAAIAVSSTAELGRILPTLLFTFLFTTLVYSPIAEWTWNPSGWIYNLGGLDFAGGTVVHISSGAAALAYSYALGRRTGYGTQELNYRPQSVTSIVLGTVLLWTGWFGFNAGSALGANLRAVMAAVVTNISACVGGLTWCLLDYRTEKKWSAVGFCSGIVAGLVVITPGSGYVPPWAAVVFGVCAGTICTIATQLKHFLRVDDAFDIFAIHGIGGLLGDLMTGVFAADYVARLDGFTEIQGGWINGNWKQVAIQLCHGATGMGWSFCVSYAILMCIALVGRMVPALRLRVGKDAEERGIDEAEIGDQAYDCVDCVQNVSPDDAVAEPVNRRISRLAADFDEDKGSRVYSSHTPAGRWLSNRLSGFF